MMIMMTIMMVMVAMEIVMIEWLCGYSNGNDSDDYGDCNYDDYYSDGSDGDSHDG